MNFGNHLESCSVGCVRKVFLQYFGVETRKITCVVTPFRSKAYATVAQVQQKTNISDGASTPAHGILDIRSPKDGKARIATLIQRVMYLQARYEQLGEIDDLNEVIVLDQEALLLYPSGHPDRSMPLSNLAADLTIRYKQLEGIDDLNAAVVLGREVISLRPPGHPDRSVALNRLATRLLYRYNRLGEVGNLNEAIVFDQEALSLCPPGHPDRARL